MPNTVGAIAVTKERENFMLQFTSRTDPSLRLLHDVTAAVSL